MRQKSIAVIIVAAGNGERVSTDGVPDPKQYRLVAGVPVLSRTAQAFLEHAGVTGLVITKLDGSAKGGFVLAVQERTGIPVKLLGQGEGIGDLTGFTPHVFAASLVD